jgi:hypothetical protein
MNGCLITLDAKRVWGEVETHSAGRDSVHHSRSYLEIHLASLTLSIPLFSLSLSLSQLS